MKICVDFAGLGTPHYPTPMSKGEAQPPSTDPRQTPVFSTLMQSETVPERGGSHPAHQPNMQRYSILQVNYAQGATASVDVALDRWANQRVAIKKIPKFSAHSMTRSQEAIVHLKASEEHHEHILCLLDVIDCGPYLKLVMPFLSGGDLLDAIPPDTGLDNSTAIKFATQMFSAISHLHALGIAHRDIKPENLMLSRDRQTLKICDFGYAVIIDSETSRHSHEGVGTLPYLAPELFGPHGQPSTDLDSVDWRASDIWSAGICLFAMITGRFPWGAAHAGSAEFSQFIKKSHSDGERARWDSIPIPQRTVIYRLLSISPLDRPTAMEGYLVLRRMDFNLSFSLPA